MIRKAIATALFIVLGLYLPAATVPDCVCLADVSAMADGGCCEAKPSSCCGADENSDPCCGDPDCCVVVPDIPDGQEPALTHAPVPVPVPLPLIQTAVFGVGPSQAIFEKLEPVRPPPPSRQSVARHSFGVWRL